ncbi:MAG: hypothetical protein WC699_03060 [Bacteroidales bacterium]|jgi:hypothetical protein
MKKSTGLILTVLVMICFGGAAFGQNAQDTISVKHKIIKQNGVAFVGKIISQDAREVLIETEEMGLVYIPKHEIKEISMVNAGQKGINGELFSTRYFLTTNGFPVKKGDNYIQWNLFGPDFQFGIADHFGVGIMTSWVGMPIIGTAKYSLELGKNLHGGLGFLGGTGSWAYPETGLLLPFGFFAIGNRMNNINFSAGYGALFNERTVTTYTLKNTPTEYSTNSYTSNSRTFNDSEGRVLFSVAGTFRLNNKFSFVFDSFFMLAGKETTSQVIRETYIDGNRGVTYSIYNEVNKRYPLVVLVPGLRFQASANSSFQFGFTGVHFDGEFIQVPIPMVQWFRKI